MLGTVRLGTVVSTTVMVCVAVAELPHASVALNVRVMRCLKPAMPVAIESVELMLAIELHVSDAVALPVLATLVLLPHSICTDAGGVMVGGVVSMMRMRCVPELDNGAKSVAVQLRLTNIAPPHVVVFVSLNEITIDAVGVH